MSQNISEISIDRNYSDYSTEIEHRNSSKSEERHSRRQLLLNKKLITLLIQNKDEDILIQFIETSGVDINYFNNEYNPLFHLLRTYRKTKKSIIKYIKILNNFNLNYNIVLEDGHILLFEFLTIEAFDCLQVLKLAKEHGANMYQLDEKKRNLLMYAIKVRADLKIIKYLYSLNYNLKHKDIDGNTIYNYASVYHNAIFYREVLPFLLKNFIYDSNVIISLIIMGKNKQPVSRETIINTIKSNNELINTKNNIGDNAFFIAIKNHYHINILSDFIYLGSRVDEVDSNGLNPLMIAIENGNFKAFSFLRRYYTDLNYKNKNGDTILITTVKKNDLKMALLLLNFCETKDDSQTSENKKNNITKRFQSKILEQLNFENNDSISMDTQYLDNMDCINNLNINEQNNEGETALSLAVKNQNQAMIYYLLICGADPSIANNKKETAIINAVQTNNEDIVDLILNVQDEVNDVDENHDTALIIAIRNSNINIVSKLLEKNVDVTIRDKDSNTPLMIAVSNDNNIEIVQRLLTLSKNTLNDVDKNGKTAFLKSVENNSQNITKLLMEYGASISKIDMDSKRNNSLLLASKHGNYEVVCSLIENNYIDIDSQNENLNTALIKASKHNWLNIVKFLLRKKAKIEIKNKKGNTALMAACMKGNHDVVKCLLDYGADIECFNNNGITPVIIACQNNDLSLAQILIVEYNAIINYEHALTRKKMEECFIDMVEQGHYKIVKLLLRQGYQINISNRNNNFFRLLSALIYDANNAYYNVLEVILPHPSFKDLLKEFRQTKVLIPACQQMKKKTIDLLLKYDINVNIRDEHNNTALIEASAHPFLFNYVKEFINRKAELNVINDEGISALLNSCKDSSNKIFKYLVGKGANIHITDLYGNNVLMHACCYDDLEKIKYLLKKHININSQNNDGDTALMQSIRAGKGSVIKLLLHHGANVNVLNNKNQNALVIAFLTIYEKAEVEYKSISLIKTLMDKKANPNIPVDEIGNSILMYLIMKNDYNMIKYMIKVCFDTLDFNHKNHLGHNAFTYALKSNNDGIISLLISTKQISVYEEDDHGNNMIMYSICNRNPEYAKKFIRHLHGNMINKCNHNRESYLIMAAKINNEKVIDVLLNNEKTDVNHQESQGNTALHYAARQGNIVTIKNLIKHKANIEIQNYQRETPLMVACRFKQKEAIKVFLDSGANSLFIDNEIYSDRKSFDFKNNQTTYIDLMVDYYDGICDNVPENYLSTINLLQRMKKFYNPVIIKDRYEDVEDIIKGGLEEFFDFCIEAITNPH